VALALGTDEASHPNLATDGSSRWDGYINVLRAGEYRFAATLRGRIVVRIDGNRVFASESAGEKAALVEGAPVALAAGVWPFVIEFSRPAGTARLELFWQSESFRREPLPFDVCFHDP